MIDKAKEQLILRRDTHIDGLLDRLKEPRVRNIIDLILSGKSDIRINLARKIGCISMI